MNLPQLQATVALDSLLLHAPPAFAGPIPHFVSNLLDPSLQRRQRHGFQGLASLLTGQRCALGTALNPLFRCRQSSLSADMVQTSLSLKSLKGAIF